MPGLRLGGEFFFFAVGGASAEKSLIDKPRRHFWRGKHVQDGSEVSLHTIL